MTPADRKRVLVVDDSALIRRVLTLILARHPGLEVVGTATDPYDAREKIKALAPDVLTLDVEMPRMDGLTFLGKLRKAHPMPVVMVSSLTARGTATAMEALAMGAVDVIGKPELDPVQGLEAMGAEIAETVYAAALAQIGAPADAPAPSGSAPVPPAPRAAPGRQLVAIGSSTGGTEALREIFQALPPGLPPITVVQHMLPGFTEAFAARLDRICQPTVKVVDQGEPLARGTIYLAPSNRHLQVERRATGLVARLQDSEPVSRHRPSATVLFDSVATACGTKALGIILTGMGDDGAEGLLHLRRTGARTLGQDEATSVVYGMPRVAWSLGAVARQSPLGALPRHILDWCSET
ncbi:chemotaxis response regulator protein-glutamate methylesterase [Geothrix rubra]|uniref:Protein-glutamate methylesterase/protein-glutamine glutaminase n=1 Tax=Geothrix rubra TaxID=2927977 RepID=A0ABQ5Q309_9BACT|nr:chemotaxis response regulator protein-glutamate methylesterase [Geothrix rubra]GLH69145.1 chemotaxis response regulator protein-glutamate methylesterase [Geothrix rubra]